MKIKNIKKENFTIIKINPDEKNNWNNTLCLNNKQYKEYKKKLYDFNMNFYRNIKDVIAY